MNKTIRRGQVWFYKPTVTPSGHIQKGSRPVIIVSNDKLNASSSVVLAVPCTSQIKRNFPTHALFIMDGAVSVALTEQMGPVNVDELVNLKATLEGYVMDQVDEALKISLGFSALPINAPVTAIPYHPPIVNNCVDKVNNPAISSQVSKFYSKYPHLKPQKESTRNRWTPERIKQLVIDYEASDDSKKVAEKYNLSVVTLDKYYRKFKMTITSDKEGK